MSRIQEISQAFGTLLLILVSSPLALPSTVKQVTITEMVAACPLIFEGQVIRVDPRADGDSGRIVSHVTFQVLDTVKGSVPMLTLELSFWGGTIGDRTMEVSDLHIPQLGERGIYFVRSTTQRMVNPLCGWDQGHFLITGDLRVLTRAGKKITDVQPTATVQSGYSAGIASGVRTSNQEPNAGLTVNQFKDKLRRMVTQ